MNLKNGRYYHVSGSSPRKWTPLGDDINEARRLWAEIECEPVSTDDKTFSVVGARYMREVLPTLRAHTQRDYQQYFRLLEAVFGSIAIDVIRPYDIAEYLRVRGETSKVRANREKALFSTIFNHARSWGYTDLTNPCIGIKGHKEKARDRYVSDDEYRSVWACAHPTVQDAMDLALYTGQRPADVLKITTDDIHDGKLAITQNKTGKKLRISIEGELAEVVQRIMQKPRQSSDKMLLQDADGSSLTYFALRSRFDIARKKAGVSFQFRDIRAKAATDAEDLAHAQSLLGHKNRSTTEIYTRERRGEIVRPLLKRK
ncbi:tyrosine-type recombinase/integrase [Herbaspirillum sp. DW155]|uniref:tyrosine-type recombinase/integrase n=1 Tax=Herbaspirillum sp. DW155 TaxID=3095609 RepID=UPI00308C57F6|nr:tyrosine-type recombinase/integrase [Herbaspirillum sp. DW155]